MPALLAYLVSAVTGAIGWVIARTGLKLAIVISAIALWLVLIVTFTASVNACFSSVCGTWLDWTRLSSPLKFGLSLAPANSGTAILFIVAAKLAGWTAIVFGRVLRAKASVAGVELR